MYLEENIRMINEKLTALKKLGNVAVWGAAENTVRLFQYTDIAKYKITTMIDNGKRGSQFLGKSVIAAEEANWADIDGVVISSFYRENEIFRELTEKFSFRKTIVRLNQEGWERPFYQYLIQADMKAPPAYGALLEQNRKFENLHRGERLFLIGNGPSIQNTDLLKLRNERKMVVSNFYLHKDSVALKPDYYCFTRFPQNDLWNEDFQVSYLNEIGKKAGNPQFFFNISEEKVIERSRYFDDKKVNYMYLSWVQEDYYDAIDMTGKIMEGRSVPIDCLQWAIYMGFAEIYLVGIEHSEIISGRYDYFYERKQSVTGDKDPTASGTGEMLWEFQTVLHAIDGLWRQYEVLKAIADKKGIKIYNATKGGILDVFERVDYDSLF